MVSARVLAGTALALLLTLFGTAAAGCDYEVWLVDQADSIAADGSDLK